jgi:ribosomal protein S12 methylthiotransferase accessory factor
MPESPRPLRDGSVAAALGVTRVARLTTLDRTGIEVASAIRPSAHVLGVTNGKGGSFAAAAAGALLEAAELFASERGAADAWGSAAELARRLGPDAVLPASALAPDGGEGGWDETRIAWRRGVDLVLGSPLLAPAHAVHCPPAGGPLLGPALVRWTSNGMGAHPRRADALLHALLEAVERDLLARALPEGFTEREIAARLLARPSLRRSAPRAAALADRVEARGLRVHLLDVSGASRAPGSGGGRGRRGLGLPCAAALLAEDAHGAVPLAAGYACRLRRDDALVAALLEAAQSRATEIHGAREDVLLGDRRAAAPLLELLARARARRDAALLPDVRAASPSAAARAIVLRLARAGVAPVAAVSLDAPAGLSVVKVLAPGLLLSELL